MGSVVEEPTLDPETTRGETVQSTMEAACTEVQGEKERKKNNADAVGSALDAGSW